MKANNHHALPLKTFRGIALIALTGIVLAFVWNGGTGKAQGAAAQNGASPAFAWQATAGNAPAASTPAAPGALGAATRLEGRFSPDNGSLLIEQLLRAGFIDLYAYHLNADGSASIMAMRGQQPNQPIVTIVIDKGGTATATAPLI